MSIFMFDDWFAAIAIVGDQALKLSFAIRSGTGSP